MKGTKVSIITPCLNSKKTIRQTIESVLNQTYENIEYIIVDGGSTDGTLAVIREYAPLFQGRLKYVSEKDRGIYDAMNKGIRLSTGRMIGIINSDDWYEPDAVEQIMSEWSWSEKYQVIYGYCKVFENDRIKLIMKNRHEGLPKAMISHPTCFVTREIYQDFGMFLRAFRILGDYELMIRLHNSRQVSFIQIKKILANYRTGGASDNPKLYAKEYSIVHYLHGLQTFKGMLGDLLKLYLC